MGLFRELRSSLENPQTPLSFPAEWLLDIFNGGTTDSGIRVSELTALQVSTVYAAVDLISGCMASLDLNVYERLQPRGKRLAWEQDLHWLLHDEPNPEMSAFTLIKTLQCHALLWTNAYCEIERDQANRPIGLWPRNPAATRPKRLLQPQIVDGERLAVGTLVFQTTDGVNMDKLGEPRYIPADNMIHVPGLSLDGRLGKPIIELSRQVIGLALAAEKFGGKFFANGIRPTGVFELPNDMAPLAVDNFKRSIQEAYGGENMLRPMVAEAGITWKQSTITPNDAQFLETRKHQREEIGALFHVPLRMLGDSSKTNKSSAEQEGIELVQYTLRPWIKAWEPELKRKLFTRVGRTANKFFPAFYYQDLLTPDAESRGKLMSLIKQWGLGNSDDIRENFLDWNPIGGKAGETYWMPVNMCDASVPLIATKIAIPPAEEAEPGKKAKEDDERLKQAYEGLFSDAFGRFQARAKHDFLGFKRSFTPVLMSIATAMEAPLELAIPVIALSVVEMHLRSPRWTDADAISAELARAIEAIRSTCAPPKEDLNETEA